VRKLLLVLLLAITAFPLYTANTRISVNTGHKGPVNTLVFDENSGFLFSGGNDGTVRIWDPDKKIIVDVIQASHLNILKISVNPKDSQIAVLETDYINNFRLSVWDWKNKERLYSRYLKEVPLFIRFSSQGNFILYGETDWQSLTFLNSKTGFRLPYLQQGFGIISFAEVSTSENTIMTYSSSTGMISYWDILVNSRKPKLQVSSIPNLRSLAMLTKRFMVGATDEELIVIDVLTGEKIDTYYQPNIQNIAVNPLNGDILCYGILDDEPYLSLFQIFQKTLMKNYFSPRYVSPSIKEIAFYNNRLFVAEEDGSISYYLPVSGTKIAFSNHNLLDITDMVFSDSRVQLATEESILTLASDFFNQNLLGSPEVTYIQDSIFPNPFNSEIGLESYLGGDLLIWKKSGESGSYIVFNAYSGYSSDEYDAFAKPLLSLEYKDRTIITLEEDGTIRLINPVTQMVDFQYASIGIQSVILIPGKAIVAGKNVTNLYESPMLHINPYTGETVGIENDAFIIYALAHDSRKDILYSLSLRKDGDQTKTEIFSHRGETYDELRKITSFNAADLSGDIIVDNRSSALFISAGYNGIKKWDGKTIINFETTDHIPRKLYLDTNYLYSLNRDGSVSIWFKGTGAHLLDFYIFKDHGWLGIAGNGAYFTDSKKKGERYITAFDSEYDLIENFTSEEMTFMGSSRQDRAMDWQ
jgi:WD40 repeat protein